VYAITQWGPSATAKYLSENETAGFAPANLCLIPVFLFHPSFLIRIAYIAKGAMHAPPAVLCASIEGAFLKGSNQTDPATPANRIRKA
jgi:hypothetical protein